MSRKRIAVIFGGRSPEHDVSLKSAAAVLENINREKYEIEMVGITRGGQWLCYNGEIGNIKNDTWHCDDAHLQPVTFDRFSSALRDLDAAFPVLHGQNGEDGTLQGMLSLAGIQVIGCGTLSSALCMDKDRAHKLVSMTGIKVPDAVTFKGGKIDYAFEKVKRRLHYPLFVKPVRGGSSIGISRIETESELADAVELAFKYDYEVTVEQEVPGFEVGCAIIGDDELTVGRADEVRLSCDFFDYREKYTQNYSHIYMPARVDAGTEKRIQETAVKIYRALDCRGFARVDMFLTPEGEIVFNEVNTIPGMTEHSRFPRMMAGIGMSFTEMLDRIIDSCICVTSCESPSPKKR